MAQYYVLAQDGNRYGPADIPTLQQWIDENRILPTTMLEDASTGQQLPASALSELRFPTVMPQPTMPSQPTMEATPPTPSAGPIYGRGVQVGYSQPVTAQNTSGMRADVPPEIEALKWNWGAFGCGCLWLLFHGLVLAGIGLFCLNVLLGSMSSVLGNVGAGIGWLIGFGISVWLGLNGHKLAWRYNRYESVDDYFRREQVWTILGFIGFALSLITLVFGILVRLSLGR
ncbi:Protein of unknown function (DUF2628) [Chthonomonas calidirosea]|uniref:DUF2628 domain-containing protein n=1 Tax=Chthonomonas calidirosea TaxID=454171 RepID=UPI0006DD5182|nr:DUF2628 domain-containing protein [Chthonomonas calidirosea]CEK15438.1 Protein of unknown function (DUF2628) [Chthonomonas calidirosea]